MLSPWKKSYDQPRQHIKKQRHYFGNKGPSIYSHSFSSGHVWLWELDYKESWALKNWCFWAVVLEKILESPLDCKEIQPVHPKGDQSWILLEGLMLKLKLQYFGHLMQRADIRRDPDAGKDWRQEEKGTTEDEMVGWHHWLDAHEFEQLWELDKEAWHAAVYGVTKSQTRLSDWTVHVQTSHLQTTSKYKHRHLLLFADLKIIRRIWRTRYLPYHSSSRF